MPFQEPEDTQPFPNRRTRRHRRYVPATWAAPGTGGGHPKLEGGYEVDQHGNPIPTRGLNRVDQRYAQDPATLQSNRELRAAAENGSTLCLLGINDEIEVRGTSGNCWDCKLTSRTCDCPDFYKLRQSYPLETIDCKHILIAEMQMLAASPGTLRWSTTLFASRVNYAISSVCRLCRDAVIPSEKINGVWAIDPVDDMEGLIGAIVLGTYELGGPENTTEDAIARIIANTWPNYLDHPVEVIGS